MRNNKNNNISHNRKTKKNRQCFKKTIQHPTFHLDLQQNNITTNAKRELQELSTSFYWDMSAHQISTINNNKLVQWQQNYRPYHTINQINQKRQSQPGFTNNDMANDSKQITYSNKKRRLTYTRYSQQKTKSVVQGVRPSLNLSFKNITSLSSSTHSAKQKKQVKHRPFTAKKQISTKVINLQPYGQNGIISKQKIKRNSRYPSVVSESQVTKQPDYLFENLLNSLSIGKIQGQGKNKIQQRQKMQLNFGSSNLFTASKYSSQKVVQYSHLKNNRHIKRSSQRGKWLSTGNSKSDVKCLYKPGQYSSLNKDFARISKLLNKQIEILSLVSRNE